MPTSPAPRRASAAYFRRFVAERQPSWDEAEGLLTKARGDARNLPPADLLRMAELYPEAAADLAFVQQEFGAGRLAEHLAFVVGETYRLLYRHGGRGGGGSKAWLAATLPRAVRSVLPDLGALTLLFLAACAVGFLFALERPGFGRFFVSPEMEDSLRQGKLWTESVFSTLPSSVASSFIVTNNVSVTFSAFAGGLLLGLGTVYIVALNGLMLGAAFAVCAEYGMAGRLFDFVCAHGFVEIAAILLASAAGLGLARAILAPGRAPRARALGEAGQRAVAVLLLTGLSLVVAGLVEGFVSPSGTLPTPIKATLGLILLGAFGAALVTLARRSERRSEASP